MILLVNFGGPRHLDEITSFLTALLTDIDVIRTPLPSSIQRWLFTWIARRRALKIREDYAKIGGRSPIYFDTEEIATQLAKQTGEQVLTFHRYLPATHGASLAAIEQAAETDIRVLPLFPQFSYSTTGSIARFLAKNLSPKTVDKLRWIQSYPTSSPFIGAYEMRIKAFLKEHQLAEKDTILLYSSHGLPKSYIDKGDVYQQECVASFQLLQKAFPAALNKLSFQSKFGPGEWIKPYTEETCTNIATWSEGRKQAVIVPLSFTSDHIETLYEIEDLYLPLIEQAGIRAYRCPALNLEPYWIEGLSQLTQGPIFVPTNQLIRN